MDKQTRDVVQYHLQGLIAEVVALTLDGWAVDKDFPGEAVGHNGYTVTMFRDANTVEALRVRGATIAEKPKETRAEILARARAARAAKAISAKLDTTTIRTDV